ncbi:MAG: thiamine phosphate synthase [Myxococcota bacterium]
MSAAAPHARDFSGLHVLADDDPRWPGSPTEQARAAVAGGARVVQLRAKHATDAQQLAWAREIRDLTRAHAVTFVVNDRFDLALLAEADAVHLGQGDLPPDRVPEPARAGLAIGRSTHTREQLLSTVSEPVDYVAFGPLFGTTSKEHAFDARGLDALAWAVEAVAPRPLVAIGGIDAARAPDVRAAGAAGFAVISAVAGAPDPSAATRALVSAWESPA